MKLFRLFQKNPSSNTQSISCCELTQFDCNQGRNCPLRASAPTLSPPAPSLRAERGNLQTQTRPSPEACAKPMSPTTKALDSAAPAKRPPGGRFLG